MKRAGAGILYGLAFLVALQPPPTVFAQGARGEAGSSGHRPGLWADGLLTLGDLGYASLIAMTVAQLEPVENFDAWAGVQLSGDVRHQNTWLRWGGREIGRGHVTLGLAAGPLVYGFMAGDPEAKSLGLHSLESLYAAAFIARLLKTAVGRARPGRSPDPDLFKPLTGRAAFHSFPSGHATRVFAVAATFAQELADDAPWVPYIAYPVATWTATTRVLDSAHWLTDVVGGALLGTLTANFVERLNHRDASRGGFRLDAHPLPDGGVAMGVNVTLR